MDYTKRAVKGATIVLIAYVLAGFLGYLLRLLLARNLTPTEYGLFYAVFSFVMFFTIFSDFGVGSSVTKFIPEFQVKKRKDLIKNSILFTFILQLVFTTMISLIIYFSSGWLATNYFHNTEAKNVLNIFALIFWFFSFSIFGGSFLGFQKMLAYSSLNLIKTFFALLFSFILLNLGMRVMAVTYSYLISQIFVIIFSLIMFFKIFPDFFKEKIKITKDLVKKLFKYGISITLASFGYLILSYTDTLVLTYFRPLTDVAYYNIAMPIATILIWFLAYPLSTVLLPMSSEMWSKGKKLSLRNGISSVQKYCLLGIVPISIILLSFPEIVIRVLFGNQYTGAAPALQILSVGMIFYSITYINSAIISGIGRPDVNTKIIGLTAILNLALNFILVPLFGIIGAATATSTSYLLMMIFTSLKLNKYIGLKIPVSYAIKTIGLTALLVGFIFYLKQILNLNYLLETAIISIASAFIYVGLAMLLKMIDLKEVFKLAKSLVK